MQTLATMLMTYVQRPSLNDCGIVAKSLLQTYPFLKDDTGSDGEDGEVHVYCALKLMSDGYMYMHVTVCSIPGNGLFTIVVKTSIETLANRPLVQGRN